ncbi:intron Large complex component GCFC2 isoform X2 [Tiliqua scincoides]|uniref:intron Large complex component GCFC2 isoform X2 n=1 Tax=Tiliqua scincoides TaxID=71010 RepID=UPI0034622AD1
MMSLILLKAKIPVVQHLNTLQRTDFIKTVRRKRLLARAECNYISLNVSDGDSVQQKEISDEGSENESDYERLTFAPKLRGPRQIEYTASVNNALSEEIPKDETQNKWEEQQIKRALKFPQDVYTAGSLCRTQHTKAKFDPLVSLPPIHVEVIKKRLTRRLTSLQDIHFSHQREYAKYIKDIEDSKSTIQELEKSSDATSNYKFYRTMNTYIGNLLNCLNEKICRINELESEMHSLLKQRAEILLKQRQEELRNESSFIQLLTRNGNSKESMQDDDKQKLSEDCEVQRGHRRRKRECSGEFDHHEGMSSDDEIPLTAMAEFQKKKDSILQDRENLFDDVHTDYCSLRSILLKFQHWKENFPDSYYDAYVSLCLPKLLNPLIRVQLIDWNPLEEDCMNLKEMVWFRYIEDFVHAKSISRFQRPDDPDENIVAKIIDKIIFPKITGFVDHVWDPLSASQTQRLVQVCKNVFEEYSFSETDSRKAKQDLLSVVISRMKKSVEDVFIPLYPKSSVEDRTSPHAKFQDRQFWSTVKLLSNILLWDGIIPEDTLQELGLNKLLNRYLLLILINTPSGLENVEKCKKVVECLPERWFRECEDGASLPQLSNFSQHLLVLARTFYKDNYSNEIKNVILLLVKVKSLRIADDFLEEHKMEHLKSILSK